MISVGSGGPQLFLSTHNALRFQEENDDKLRLIVQELDDGKRVVQFMVYPFQDIEMVKRLIVKHRGLPPATNVSELRVFFRGAVLPNHRSLATLFEGVSNVRGVPHLKLHWNFRYRGSRFMREVGMRAPPRLTAIMAEVDLAIQRGVHPKLTMDGTGGTYFLDDCYGTHIAMFKAADEEPFAPLNPRGYTGKMGQKGFRQGVLSGEGSQRELAAFLLDAQYGGFARVPQTTKVELRHPALNYSSAADPHFKEGSLQEFVNDTEMSGDYDPAMFAIGDVHRIAIFDMTVLNMDRNDCNILVRQRDGHASAGPAEMTPAGKLSKFRLIPIDHGLILPDTLDIGDCDFVWFYWPQSKLPFSPRELHHIFSLEAAKDARRLARKLGIRTECLRTLRVATTVLQLGAQMHLNAGQIAAIMCRTGDLDTPSLMEKVVQFALAQTYAALGATALQQTTRLPGRVVTDLHVASSAASDRLPSSNAVGSGEDVKSPRLKPSAAAAAGATMNATSRSASPATSMSSSSLASTDGSCTSSSCEEFSSNDDDEDEKDGGGGDDSSSQASLQVKFRGPVSKLTGVPLGRDKDIWRQLRRRRRRAMQRREQVEAFAAVQQPREQPSALAGRSHTFRKHTSLLAFRGTAARTSTQTGSAWTLQSGGKGPALDWTEPAVEHAFFSAFENAMKQRIAEQHPDWQKYPFLGDGVLEAVRRQKTKQQQQQPR